MDDDEYEDIISIVIDNGSSSCRAGFSGEENPNVVFPSVVGRPRQGVRTGIDIKECCIGNDAQQKRDLLSLRYPIKHGIVTDWDDMEKIWHHLFYTALATNPENYPVLLTEPACNPMANQEKMAEVMFETFNIPAVFVENEAILAAYATGYMTVVIVYIGDGVLNILPIFYYHPLFQAQVRIDLAGRDITDYLAALLRERDFFFASSSEMEVVREMKERLAYVALDYEAEMSKAASHPKSVEVDYSLPGDQVISVGSERFRCGEALFRPSLLKRQQPGVHEALFNSLMACDVDLRPELWDKIVLSGAGTMFPNFGERLKCEMSRLLPPTANLNIRSYDERDNHVWLGGSIEASFVDYPKIYTTRKDYEESGPSAVHREVHR